MPELASPRALMLYVRRRYARLRRRRGPGIAGYFRRRARAAKVTTLAMIYSYLCGYALGETCAGSVSTVPPKLMRELEAGMRELGLTDAEILEIRRAAVDGACGAAP